MNRIVMAAGTALIALLAGCGDVAPTDNAQIEVPGPEAYQQELKDMPEGARNATFIRAIRDAGQECQHVESSSFVGEAQGFPVWEARCTGGGVWKIILQRDGYAQVMESAADPVLDVGETANALDPINPGTEAGE